MAPPADLSTTTLALDGDDTLWHNETIFQDASRWYEKMLTGHGVDPETIHDALIATERRNLHLYGYGIKGFTLSCIETAVALTGGAIPSDAIGAIVARGRAMLSEPTVPIDGVVEALTALAPLVERLLVITKGDLHDQEQKVERSGLGRHFNQVHIVSEKSATSYQHILDGHGIRASDFVMVGNSLRSDVLPVLEIGARAVHIPYHVTWEIETVSPAEAVPSASTTLNSIRELPEALALL